MVRASRLAYITCNGCDRTQVPKCLLHVCMTTPFIGCSGPKSCANQPKVCSISFFIYFDFTKRKVFTEMGHKMRITNSIQFRQVYDWILGPFTTPRKMAPLVTKALRVNRKTGPASGSQGANGNGLKQRGCDVYINSILYIYYSLLFGNPWILCPQFCENSDPRIQIHNEKYDT